MLAPDPAGEVLLTFDSAASALCGRWVLVLLSGFHLGLPPPLVILAGLLEGGRDPDPRLGADLPVLAVLKAEGDVCE